MKKILTILILAVVVFGIIFSAGCVSSETETNKEKIPVGITDQSLFTPIDDEKANKFIGNWVSIDDMQGRITNMAGNRVYIQAFNTFEGKEHDFFYVNELDYLSTTDIVWSVIPENSPSEMVIIKKPSSVADNENQLIVDKSKFNYEIKYNWATEEFIELYKWDDTQTNVLRNHEGKQFRKMNSEEEIPYDTN